MPLCPSLTLSLFFPFSLAFLIPRSLPSKAPPGSAAPRHLFLSISISLCAHLPPPSPVPLFFPPLFSPPLLFHYYVSITLLPSSFSLPLFFFFFLVFCCLLLLKK
ncbi:hypothetical protein K457DRAFT_670411 [Linnemannia elongata AG-77]|uniref:REJ domain-containing protein n=1 Tax=Linnemannia elongata AG-77 TaxID=1314771 RepID=A0A197JR01_9FUNG|nr:hypothetical protein K457DRAFT_670411 [Linnemannia elongata AG-77]